MGTEEDTQIKFASNKNYFESGKLKEVRQFDDSIFYHIQSPTLYDYITHFSVNAYTNSMFGKNEQALKDADSGLIYIKKYGKEEKQYAQMIHFLRQKSWIYFALKKDSIAYWQIYEAYQLSQKYKDTLDIKSIFFELAMKLYEQKEYKNAVFYFKKSLTKLSTNTEFIIYRNYKEQETLDNIAECFLKMQKYDSAQVYLNETLSFIENHCKQFAVDSVNSYWRYQAAKAVALGNMARAYEGKGDHESAIKYFKEAIHTKRGFEMSDLLESSLDLAYLYMRKGQLPEMKSTLDSLRYLYKNEHSPERRMNYNRVNYLYYDKTNNDGSALKYLKVYNQIRDSLLIEKEKETKTTAERELEERDRYLSYDLLKKDNQIKGLYLGISLAGLLITVAIGYLIYYFYKKTKKEHLELKYLNLITQSQKQALEEAGANKDRILKVVAHDLRNPLSGIRAISLSLEEKLETGIALQPRQLHLIHSTAESALNLIEDLLKNNMDELKIIEKQTGSIDKLMHDMADRLRHLAQNKNQQLIIDSPNEKTLFSTDFNKLERVILNLLHNAIKFTPENGRIILSGKLNDGYLTIRIEDNGIGIPADLLPYIYDLPLGSRRDGTAGEASFGIGLSICKKIIDLLEGEILVDSKPGKGTLFTIRFRI